MRVTAADIYNQQFKKRLRGYDCDQVDGFLEVVASSFEELTKENSELYEQIKLLEHQIEEHQRKEQSIYEVLLQARQYSEESKNAAKRESELLLREAKLEANNIIRKAKDQAEQTRQETMVLQHEKEKFVTEYRAFLQAQLKMLAATEHQEGLDDSNTDYQPDLMLVERVPN